MKKSIIITTFILFILLVFTFSVSSLELGPNVLIECGNEDYWFNITLNLSSYSVDSTWVCFNDTDFNISSPNDINISIMYIHNSSLSYGDGDEILDFYVNTTSGTVFFDIGGFESNTQYDIHINNTFVQTNTSNASGVLNFTRSDWDGTTDHIEFLKNSSATYHVATFGGTVTVSQGLNLYVSTTGDDDTGVGSYANPYRTIQKALNESSAGSTVYILEGEYQEYPRFKVNGTPGNIITVRPNGTDNVIVNGSTMSGYEYKGIFHGRNNSYIRITGLEIRDSPCFGVAFQGTNISNITIDNCTIHACHNSSIKVRTMDADEIFRNISINNNTCYDICREPGTIFGGTGWVNQEGISIERVDTFEIIGNTVYWCGRECIDTKVGCSNGTIKYNNINTTNENQALDNQLGIYVDGYSRLTNDITIDSNFIYGNGSGISVNAEQATGRVESITVQNNIVNTTGDGTAFFISGSYNNPIYNLTIVNNIFHADDDEALKIDESDTYVVGLVIANNVFTVVNNVYITYCGNIDSSNVLLENNLYYDFNDDSATIHWSDDDDLFGSNNSTSNPQYANILAGQFWFNSSSPCLENGTSNNAPSYDYNGTSRPQGDYDIGAFEVAGPSVYVSYHISTFGGTVTVESGPAWSNWSVVWKIGYTSIYDCAEPLDLKVDTDDINATLNNLSATGAPGWIYADINDDGVVNYLDIGGVCFYYPWDESS